jgi:hypothetical protein
MTESNEYALWESLLAAKVAGQIPPPINPNEPACGFYRSRRKGGPYLPVAIWIDGDLCCQIDGEDVPAQKVIDSWPFISRNPVSWEAYEFYKQNGRWEDADETVHEQMTERGIGDNNPPDELALMKGEIEAASAGIAAYKEITDDQQQARAQSLRSRLLELSTGADKKREAEKKPHWDAGKAVDAKWQPLVAAAKAAADTIRAAMAKFETAKAQKARAEQEEIARKAREAAAEAAKAGKPAPPPPPAPTPPVAPQPIRGGYGRAASTRPVKVFKKITDLDAALKFFHNCPEIAEAVTAVAKSYCKNYPETELPGIETAMEMSIK